MASTGHQRDPRGSGRRSDGRRHSPAVYRRRRLAVVILALVVLAALVLGGSALAGALGGGSRGTEEPPAEAAASAGPDATPAPSAAPASAPASAGASTPAPSAPAPSAEPTLSTSVRCEPADVTVEATTDEQSYAEGEDPVLTLVLRNAGDEACVLNVGTSEMEFLVTNADGRIFSSVDCQTASEDLFHVLEPDAEETADFGWPRTRSVAGCTPVEEGVGPGTYMLTTRLGVINSSPADFTLQ